MTGSQDPRRWGAIEQIFHRVWQAPQAQRVRLVNDLTNGDQEMAQEVWSLVSAADQSESFLEEREDLEVSLISEVIRRWCPPEPELGAKELQSPEPFATESCAAEQSESPPRATDTISQAALVHDHSTTSESTSRPGVHAAGRSPTKSALVPAAALGPSALGPAALGTGRLTGSSKGKETGIDLASIQEQLAQQRPELQVLELVGSGGAGIVLRAFDRRLQRDVAIKILHRKWTERFGHGFLQREAQAGALSSDHVVRVYEVAPADAPLAYLVMEWIAGPSLRDYLAARGALPPSQAAGLVRQIALGLSAAHARGLLHGDIKPANVLLEPLGAAKIVDASIKIVDSSTKIVDVSTNSNSATEFRARVADFGLARPLAPSTSRQFGEGAGEPENADPLTVGQFEHFVGTPAYASPEQLLEGGGGNEAADIWSVGATLYHTLVGAPPYAGRPDAIMRQMRSGDPTPLRRIDPRLPRDLESICHKALQRDPARRYASAQELASDLKRFLEGQPVTARPISLPTRWLKAIRRHRLVSALVFVSVGSLMSGVVASNYYRLRAEQNLALAQQNLEQAADQRDRARTVTQLLQSMISAADPNFGDRDVTLRDALVGLERRILDDLAGRSDIEADVRSALGNMYFSLAEYERSREHLQRATELRNQTDDLTARLKDQTALANTLRWLYLPEEAHALCRTVIDQAQEQLGPFDLITLSAREVLAGCLQDLKRYEQAESEYRHVIDQATGPHGQSHPLVLSARAGLASTFIDAGRYAQAENELRNVLDLRRSADVAGNRDDLIIQSNLATTLAELGRLSEAIEQQRQVVTATSQLLGPLHDSTLVAKMNLAESIRRSGDQAAALELNEQMLQDCRAEFGWAHPSTLGALEGVVLNLVRMEQYREALAVLESSQSELELNLAPGDDWLHRTRSFKAAALSGLGEHDVALPLYLGAIEHFEHKYGALAVLTLTTKNNYGLALIQAGQADAADALYGGLLTSIDQRFDSMRPVLMRNQGHARLKAGRLEQARVQLEAAKALSQERGELENVGRCQNLLDQLSTLTPPTISQ